MALIILDVDETLIHACPEWIGRKPDFMAADQMIFIRPYAKALIRLALQQHQVAVWTASYGQYTREILAELFDDLSDIAFIWDRNDCRLCSDESGHDYFAKDLSKIEQLSWGADGYVVIDDQPEYILGNSKYIIGVKPYFGSLHDDALVQLAEQLEL